MARDPGSTIRGVDHFESNLTVQHFVPSQVFEYYDGNL